MLCTPRFANVVAATLLSAPCIVHGQEGLKTPEAVPAAVTPITKDHLIAVVPNFFYFDYPFQPQPGKRLWLRVDDEHWIERYPDGTESRFKTLGRTIARGESGTVAGKIEGDSARTGTEN